MYAEPRTVARTLLRDCLPKRNPVPTCNIGVIDGFVKSRSRMSILRIAIRHSVLLGRAKLRSCARKSGSVVPLLLSPERYRQIRCSHTICIDSSTRNLSVVIYVFGSFETNRKAAFEIVEVCGVGCRDPK